MQSPTGVAIHRFSIIAIITFFLSYGLDAQGVVIKEKISIAPKASSRNIVASFDDLIRSFILEYPAEVKNAKDIRFFWGGPTQDPYNGDTIWHFIWPVTCNGIVVRLNSSDQDYNHYNGEYWLFGGTFGIFGPGVALTFDWFPGLNPGYYNECYIGEDTIDAYPGNCGGFFDLYEKSIITGEYIRTNIVISIDRVDFCPPFKIVLNDSAFSSIMYGESKNIIIGSKDACGKLTYYESPIPVDYHVAITSGNEFGYLYNQATGEYGDTISVSAEYYCASFMFSATENQPTEDQQVKLRVWSDDPSYLPDTTTLTVRSTSCMSISISKPMINPSMRDSIAIYPADQIYSIRLITNEQYGMLRCPATGEEGISITGPQPFEFIAADNIDGDSIVVEIQASIFTGGGGLGSIHPGKDTLRLNESVMASKQSAVRNIGDVSNEMKRKNIELSMNSLQAQLNKVSARKSDEKQQQKLALDIEQLKAQLAYETAKTPIEKQNALASIKQIAKISSVQETCNSTVSVTIKKNQFTGFSQNDKAWSDSLYDSTKKTIGVLGCALCNMASILKLLGYDVTPLTLNDWMVKNGYYSSGGGVDWKALTDYASENIISYPLIDDAGQLHTDKNNSGKLIGTPITLDDIDTYLNHGYYIVAEVKNIHDDGTERTHFVRIEGKGNGTYNIYDPGYKNRTTLASYNNQIYRAIYYIVYK